jgi:capsular polysaccharide biosynthesis protein
MCCVTGLALFGAMAATLLQHPTYSAQVRVLVEVALRPGDAARTPDMGTEKAVATSDAVEGFAADQLGLPAATVRSAASVSVPVNANVLVFHYTARTRATAEAGVAATAAAYVQYRSAPARAAAGAGQVPSLLTRVITPAALPGGPSGPDWVLNLIAGIVVGALAALAVALGVERFGSRLRVASRWQDATGVPVLLEMGRRGHRDTSARIIPARDLDYLRARLAPGLALGRTVLVTSVHEQPERAAVARGLADAFELAGTEATVVTVADGLVAAAMDAARWRPRVVIVDAPALAASVAGLDAARVCDAVVLVDDLTTARRRDALGAVAELRAANANVVGAALAGVHRPRTGRLATAPARFAVPAPEPAGRPVDLGLWISKAVQLKANGTAASDAGESAAPVNGRQEVSR